MLKMHIFQKTISWFLLKKCDFKQKNFRSCRREKKGETKMIFEIFWKNEKNCLDPPCFFQKCSKNIREDPYVFGGRPTNYPSKKIPGYGFVF
jgi:hypothetical protein